MTLFLAFLLGVFAGLRSLSAPMATSWAVYLGWLRLDRPLSLVGSLPSVIILTLLSLGELIADKLPKTPARTAPPGLIARIVTGAFCGACIATAGGAGFATGAVLGAIGGLAGCFGGYFARTRLVRALGVPGIYIALAEDVVAVAGSFWVVSRF